MVTVNEYARARGKVESASPSPQPLPPQGGVAQARPMTEAEQARAAESRAMVREHLPEAMPFIKELHEMGMIDGWRNVESVELLTEPEQGEPP